MQSTLGGAAETLPQTYQAELLSYARHRGDPARWGFTPLRRWVPKAEGKRATREGILMAWPWVGDQGCVAEVVWLTKAVSKKYNCQGPWRQGFMEGWMSELGLEGRTVFQGKELRRVSQLKTKGDFRVAGGARAGMSTDGVRNRLRCTLHGGPTEV